MSPKGSRKLSRYNARRRWRDFPKILQHPDPFQGFTWRTYAWTHIVRIWSCKFVLRGVVIVVPGDALSARESILKAEDKTCSMHPVHQKSEEGFRKKSLNNLQLLLPLSSCHAFCLRCVSFVNIRGQFPKMWPTWDDFSSSSALRLDVLGA